MKTAILTGGTGFLGNWLLKELIKNNIFVYTVVRKNSKRIDRLKDFSSIEILEIDMNHILDLKKYVKKADFFYNLAWEGERDDYDSQMDNIEFSVNAMKVAKDIGVKLFVMTGSQAEYGIYHEKVNESSLVNPASAYGSCKVACYYILNSLSKKINIPLTWVRVFSVYGEGDNPNTLISYLFKCFKENTVPELTKCDQLWDFLYAEDAAKAIYLLGLKHKSGIYNLAYGESKPLKEFVIKLRNLVDPNIQLSFNTKLNLERVELIANTDKIRTEIEWRPTVNFEEGIKIMLSSYI